MADADPIRVVISATAAEFRSELRGAKGDVGSLSAQIKAVPDRIRVDVAASTAQAMSRLRELEVQADRIPDRIEITADADVAPAIAKLEALGREARSTRVSLGLSERLGQVSTTAALGALASHAPQAGLAPALVYGVRGPTAPGSITNPLVTVLEAAKYTSLGSQAAAIGTPAGASAPPVAIAPAGGGGRGGGDGVLPVALGGGGGGGRGPLAALGLGTGIAGFAGIGSALSFAGLGFEHLITTLLGIAGSAAGGAAGGGLIGLGGLGQLAVGTGSDLAVMKSTISDTQTLSKALTQVQSAQQLAFQSGAHYQQVVAQYGPASKQAVAALAQYQSAAGQVTTAQAALNQQIALLGNTAGVRAELGLAKATSALNTFWDAQTSGARVQAVAVLMQGIKLATDFVPLIAGAAQRNLAVINQSLKPLFAWLEGPQGVQIFSDLENRFAADLPTAIHAFTQALELILRITDIASQHTGGFIGSLDHLATRLNSLDSATLSAEVSKLVGDFRLWETFVKLLAEDVFLLFHQDVGTGNSIIATLDQMLLRLHAYETSARGSAQIQSIFMIHKTEIQALLHILGGLISTFASVYLAVAPALVAAMNNVVLPVLELVVGALAAIARTSPFAATAIGLGLIAAKAGGILATANAVKALVQWLLGAKTASEALAGAGLIKGAAAGAGAAAAGGAAVGAGAAGASLGTLELGATGLGALGLAGVLPVIASAVATVLPIVLASGAVYLAANWIDHVLGLGKGQTHTVTPASTPAAIRDTTAAATGGFHGTDAKIERFATDAHGPLNIQEIGKFAHYSTGQLVALIAALKQTNDVKVNGIKQPRDQVLALAEAALKAREAWNRSFDGAWQAVNRFFLNTSRTLPALEDDFHTVLRKINSEIGLSSTIGLKQWGLAISEMVAATTQGMLEGKIKTTAGLQAINTALSQGVKSGAITWKTQWEQMFGSLDALYAQHKVKTGTYLSDLRQIMGTGFGHVRSDTEASQKAMFDYLKQQESEGNLTHGEFLAKWHQAQTSGNATAKTDMATFALQIANGMLASGHATDAGMKAVVGELNQALGLMGSAKVSLPQLVGLADLQSSTASLLGGGTPAGSARGGWIGSPGQAGHDQIPIVVGAGEAVLNRHQQGPVEAALHHTYGIGLGELFSSVTRPHYMASGGFAGARSGTASYGQLEGLWTSAGGPKGLAPLAAAIAEAESGGQDVMQQGQPFATTGWGYWQITPGGPQYLDPMTNAREAVSKWASAPNGGHNFTPWTTFTSGAYRSFLHGGVPALGGLGQIAAPKVRGGGVLAHVVAAALGISVKAANAYLAKHAPAGGVAGSGAGGVGPTGGAFSPGQLGSFDGFRVADWIIPELQYARAHGWGGRITSGYRAGFDPHAPSGSEHALDIYPGGAVDFGGMVDPAGAANRAAFIAATAGYSGRRLLTPIGFRDDGHMSGTGHARGGFISAAGGGPVKDARTGRTIPRAFLSRASHPRHRPVKTRTLSVPSDAVRKLRSHTGVLGEGGPLPFETSDMGPIADALSRILKLDGGSGGSLGGGDAQHMSDLIQWYSNLWTSGVYPAPNFSSIASPADFVISTDPQTGQPVAPYISPHLDGVVGQLGQILGYQGRWVGDLQGALGISEGMGPALKAAISRRVGEISRLRARLNANLKRMAELRAKIKAERAKKLPYAHPKTKAQHTANASFDADRKKRIADWETDIKALQAENVTLGGSPDSIGTAGELGAISAQLGSPTQAGSIATVLGSGSGASGLYQLQADASDWARQLGGTGGDIATQQLAQSIYQQDLAQLGPGASAAQAAAAAAAAAQGSAQGPSAADALLAQLLAQTQTDLAVSQSQFGVLQGFEPLLAGRLVGSFASGIDFVPRTGLALVHRGETITPDPQGPYGNTAATVHTAHGDISIELVFANNEPPLVKLVDARINQRGLRVVSDHSGQRARLMAGVTRP